MNYEDRVTKEYVEGLLAGMPKVYAGTYIGTGTYGPGCPTSITFPFTPKLVLLWWMDCTAAGREDTSYATFLWNYTTRMQFGGYASNNVSYSGNTMAVVGSGSAYDSPQAQFNENGYNYHYLAIG